MPEQHVPSSKHPDAWLGLEVFLQAPRDAITNVINKASAVTSIDGLHYAQDFALGCIGLAEERRRQPHAGSLFRYRPGMTELPPFAHEG